MAGTFLAKDGSGPYSSDFYKYQYSVESYYLSAPEYVTIHKKTDLHPIPPFLLNRKPEFFIYDVENQAMRPVLNIFNNEGRPIINLPKKRVGFKHYDLAKQEDPNLTLIDFNEIVDMAKVDRMSVNIENEQLARDCGHFEENPIVEILVPEEFIGAQFCHLSYRADLKRYAWEINIVKLLSWWKDNDYLLDFSNISKRNIAAESKRKISSETVQVFDEDLSSRRSIL